MKKEKKKVVTKKQSWELGSWKGSLTPVSHCDCSSWASEVGQCKGARYQAWLPELHARPSEWKERTIAENCSLFTHATGTHMLFRHGTSINKCNKKVNKTSFLITTLGPRKLPLWRKPRVLHFGSTLTTWKRGDFVTYDEVSGEVSETCWVRVHGGRVPWLCSAKHDRHICFVC